jgi:hypothetical protein
MNDPDGPAPESSIARALRLKKAALEAKPKRPGADISPEQSARMPSGASKPWMKR